MRKHGFHVPLDLVLKPPKYSFDFSKIDFSCIFYSQKQHVACTSVALLPTTNPDIMDNSYITNDSLDLNLVSDHYFKTKINFALFFE